MNKSDLRRKHIQLRQEISEPARQRLSSLIFLKLKDLVVKHQSVGVYISTEFEVDTRQLIDFLFQHHIRVCVPKVLPEGMIFVEIGSLHETRPNKRGILEPIQSEPCNPPELMIVPMLAYNEKAYRLGYGKAYYDQYLKSYPGPKVGICFDINREPELMAESHDIPCDVILTNTHHIVNKLDIIGSLGDVSND